VIRQVFPLPYISSKQMSQYKSAQKQASSLRTELDALKASTVPKDTFFAAKKSLSEAATDLSLAKKKIDHYTKLYTGMTGKYNMTKTQISSLESKIDAIGKTLDKERSRSKMFEKKYENAVKSGATSKTILTKMKIQHQRDMQRLLSRVKKAEKEAESAIKQASDLLSQIDEIEKNERMAREGSLTQAVVNTRDLLFDNTIAGVQLSETSSRGLSMLAGAAVFSYLMTRVS